MNKHQELILQTQRLILRDLKKSDWQSVHEYASNPEVVKYTPWGPNSIQDTKAFLKKTLSNQQARPRVSYDFALESKSDGKVMGTCAIMIRNIETREAKLGYVLNQSYWNQGYMTEAARKVVALGFTELKMHRIFATCDPANTGSFRVMEKTGMKKEGHLREHTLIKGRFRDSLLYSILEKDWLKQQNDAAATGVDSRAQHIEYVETVRYQVDVIKPMWERLNEQHKMLSRNFSGHYTNMHFDLRKKQLEEKSSGGGLHLVLARDTSTGNLAGYCVASINSDKQGEIDSIYVEPGYRGCGVGDRLMGTALNWLESMRVNRTILEVVDGNEGVFEFYRRYGFFARRTVLEQKPRLSR